MKTHVLLTKKGCLALIDRGAALVSGKERALLVTLHRSPEHIETLQRLRGWPLGMELFESLLQKGLIRLGPPETLQWSQTSEVDLTFDRVITRLSEGMSEEDAVRLAREAAEKCGLYFITGAPFPREDFRALLNWLVRNDSPFVSMLASSMLVKLG